MTGAEKDQVPTNDRILQFLPHGLCLEHQNLVTGIEHLQIQNLAE